MGENRRSGEGDDGSEDDTGGCVAGEGVGGGDEVSCGGGGYAVFFGEHREAVWQ